MKDSRRGVFRIRIGMIEEAPELVRKVMGKCVIVKAECLYGEDALEFFAVSPDFEEVPKGVRVPRYKVLIKNIGMENEIIFMKEGE